MSGAKVPYVLVADDEEVIRDFYVHLLSREGYIVDTAKSAKEALDKTLRRYPDLVILDVVMPDGDGFSVCKEVKENEKTKDIPVIIATALKDREAVLTGLKSGADEFLSKPLDPTELSLRIRNMLTMKEFHDQLKHYQRELEREVEQRTLELDQALRQLEAAHLNTIYRLSRAAEYKDEMTGKHIRRIGLYCGIIARELGLGEDEVRIITQAAPLHDVGKIGIPDDVLLKPGKLTPEERAIMEQHTLIGAEILGRAWDKYLQAGEVIALTHHEWFDGSGYPFGLKMDKIPLFGRIAAIADVFDALTSERPYKPQYGPQKVIQIMDEEADRHFDPAIYATFKANLDEVLKIRETLAD